jgi:outer membrane protein OmpA-like peptidoglycan-associated protein
VESEDVLREFAAWHAKYPLIEVITQAHCAEPEDCEAPGADGLRLDQRRATVVRDFLAKSGVDPKRLSIEVRGSASPAVTGESETAFAQNRRAVLAIL